jgi:acyl carrier protein
LAQELTDREILRQLESLMREKLEWQGDLRGDLRLAEDLRLDSLQLLTLAVEVENCFRIKLSPEEEAGIQAAGDLVRLVRMKTASKTNSSR